MVVRWPTFFIDDSSTSFFCYREQSAHPISVLSESVASYLCCLMLTCTRSNDATPFLHSNDSTHSFRYTDNVGGVQNADGGGRLTTASVLPPAPSTASYPLLNAAENNYLNIEETSTTAPTSSSTDAAASFASASSSSSSSFGGTMDGGHTGHTGFTTTSPAPIFAADAGIPSATKPSSSFQGILSPSSSSSKQRGYVLIAAAVLALLGFGIGIGVGVSVGKSNTAFSAGCGLGEGGEMGEVGTSSASENGEMGGAESDGSEDGEDGEDGEHAGAVEEGGGSASLFPSGLPPAPARPLPVPEAASAGATPFDYAAAGWYTRLMASPVTKRLSNVDFSTGTFRITKPGRYQLAEDIYFAPNANLKDPKAKYWPPIHSQSYPMGQFYLGFFAAVTYVFSGSTTIPPPFVCV